MDAVTARDKAADLALREICEACGVFAHKRVELIPTHITAVLARVVLGIGLGSLGEIKRSGVDLVEHALRRFRVVGVEEDMGGTLRAVEAGNVSLGIGENVLVGRIVALEGLHEALLQKGGLDVALVLVLGHADRLERLVPLVVARVVLFHLVDVGLHLVIAHRDALFLGALDDQLLGHEGIDDLLAHLLGGVVVFDHPLAPRVLVGQRHLGADALDGGRNLFLLDFGAVDGRRHASNTLRSRRGITRARRDADHTQGGQAHRANGLSDCRSFHETLPFT